MITLFRYYLKIGLTKERIIKVASFICTNFKLQTTVVCNSGVQLLFSELFDISKNVSMSTAEICFFIMDDICEETKLPSWTISFPSNPKPKVKETHLPKMDAPKLKVLHLSDAHNDPLYMVGANADCPEPLCCREQNGFPNISASAAGKWGHYKCDVPRRTIEHLLDHIHKTHSVRN